MNRYKYKAIIQKSRLAQYLDDYLTTMLVIGRSEHTYLRHQTALREFILWCVRHDLGELTNITRDDLKHYRKYQFQYRKTDGKPLTKGSLNSKLTPLKRFFEWCTDEKYIPFDIAFDLEIPRKPKGLPTKILMHDAVEHILDQPDISTDEGFRDRAIMEVLYSTAIRRSEAAFLTLQDVDFVREEIKINNSKNGQDRVVPVGKRALAWIKRYIKQVRPKLLKGEDGDSLFLSHKGIQFLPGTLAARVKRYIDKSGIDTRGSCHLFRHSSATQMLENGADIRFLQAFLGHKDLNTTEIYTRVSPKKLREVYSQTHPVEIIGTRY